MPFLAVKQKGRSKAQSMVEFALVLPILLMIVYGLLEVGRLIFIYSTVITATREAVRYGSASGMVSGEPQYKDCVGIRNAAQHVDFLDSFNKDVDIDILYSTGNHISFGTAACPSRSSLQDVPSGGWIEVSVKATFTPMASIVPLNAMTLSSTSRRTIIGSVQLMP
jgi:hypothetical protein